VNLNALNGLQAAGILLPFGYQPAADFGHVNGGRRCGRWSGGSRRAALISREPPAHDEEAGDSGDKYELLMTSGHGDSFL
jgi:hypothetical protein